MNSNSPITLDSKICQTLPYLPDKFIVDFANGIDVARDHIRVQKDRNSIFDRFYDGFTGKGGRRQTEINASLADGVEGALKWLTEHSLSIAKSNRAIIKVNNRVAMIQGSLTELANYSVDTRQQLIIGLDNLHNILQQEVGKLRQEVHSARRASSQLDLVFSKWESGKYSCFSLSGRCYAALEELRWGAYGDFYQNCDEHDRLVQSELIQNRALIQLANDANVNHTTSCNILEWLNPPTDGKVHPDAKDALAYIGDWALPSETPFVYSTTRIPQDLPLQVPRCCPASRLAEALVTEVFGED